MMMRRMEKPTARDDAPEPEPPHEKYWVPWALQPGVRLETFPSPLQSYEFHTVIVRSRQLTRMLP